MTRAFTPPDSLSKDDIRTLGDVRRDIWTNSFRGMGFGSGTGLVLHSAVQWAKRLGFVKHAKLGRNTLVMSVLGGGALGSFLFALKTGKEEVHNLHPIFKAGALPSGTSLNDHFRSRYEKALNHAEERSEDLQAIEQTRLTSELRAQQKQTDEEYDAFTSTKYGGDDVHQRSNDADTFDRKNMDRMRVARRKTLMDSIRNGHGLSDSHGGHWVSQQQNDNP